MMLFRARPPAAIRVGIFLFFLLAAGVRAEWHVADATVRFTVELTDSPTHREAGYFLKLPDGGALPSPAPLTTVVTESGKKLASYVLWHNVASGLGIVFEDPGRDSTVLVYVSRGQRLNTWTPASGLFPSGIMCMSTKGTSQAANAMGAFGAVTSDVRFRSYRGHPKAPISVPSGGDLLGRPLPTAYYLMTHLNITDPGKTWLGLHVMNGSCEVRVDGKKLTPGRRSQKFGGTGQAFGFKKGLRRIEVMQTVVSEPKVPPGMKRNQQGSAMFLTIRTPGTTDAELGANVPVEGSKGPDKKPAGFAQMDARTMRGDEVAESGRAKVVGVTGQQNSPVAAPVVKPVYVYWLPGQPKPLIVYELSALSDGNPEGTQYTWQFDKKGTTATGSTVYWLFEGFRNQSVSLTATLDKKRSVSQSIFYAYCMKETSLDEEEVRDALRKASLTMFTSVNKTVDPMKEMGEAYWPILSQCVSIGEGVDLANHLLDERWNLAKTRLPPDVFELLKDIRLDAAMLEGPKEALALVEDMSRRTSAIGERGRLSLTEAEIRMFYFGESNTVVKLLKPLTYQTGDVGEMARVRLGDLAFINGDLNGATRFYADVQNRVRLARNKTESGGSSFGSGLARSSAELKAQREARNAPAPETPRRPQPRVENWKLSAFLGVSASETARSLINQEYWLEAKGALQAWERQFPLDKLSSDYILQEARYYMKRGDSARVRKMLGAYCSNLDNTSYMADTAWLLLACMAEQKEPRKEILDFAKEMADRFEFHPAAARFRTYFQFRE